MAEYTIDKFEYGSNVYKLQDNVSGYITSSALDNYATFDDLDDYVRKSVDKIAANSIDKSTISNKGDSIELDISHRASVTSDAYDTKLILSDDLVKFGYGKVGSGYIETVGITDSTIMGVGGLNIKPNGLADSGMNNAYLNITANSSNNTIVIDRTNASGGIVIHNVKDPTSNQDAATKKYVDDSVGAITDTKVTNTLATTTKYYMTGTTSASTNTGTQVFDSGIYATTTAGQLNATTYKVNEQVTLQWNSTDSGLDFIFA